MIKIQICVGTNCSFKGSLDLLEYLEHDERLKGKVEISTSNCFNKVCKNNNSPVVMINNELMLKATLDQVLSKIGDLVS